MTDPGNETFPTSGNSNKLDTQVARGIDSASRCVPCADCAWQLTKSSAMHLTMQLMELH